MAPSEALTDEILSDLVPSRLDALIAALDRRIGAQLDEILHHPAYQRLERAWRGLSFVVDRTRFDENIRIELLPCSRDELAADLARGERVTGAGLYRILHTRAFGRYAGEPYGAVIVDLELGPEDIPLLERCGSLAYLAMAPFIAGASPRFFGLGSWAELPSQGTLVADPRLAALREQESARALGLAMPRFLLRAPFAVEGPELAYREGAPEDEALCWGNACYALATRLTESFARYRWCPNIIGPASGGLVSDLPARPHPALATPIPTEVPIGERREYELAEHGFIPFSARAGLEGACFFSAVSLQKPKTFGESEEGRAAEMNSRLGAELPYFFIITRCLHYVSVAYYTREDPEASRADIEMDLNDWIGQYVADRDVVTAATRGRRPLRKARIIVTETDHPEAWYKLDLQLRPHFKYLGAFFTLSVVGKLDRPSPPAR